MFVTNLDKKISKPIKPKKIPTICAWSDLLGFSNPYVESDWNPSDDVLLKIAERLRNAQIVCMRNLVPSFENVLISNDAFIRNVNLERISHIDELSLWFRSLVWFHMAVNKCEYDNGQLPGIRTVISGGNRLIHNFEEVTFEDYVYNYTKKDSSGKSSITQKYGDRNVMTNLNSFQMNAAFSKSYLIDSSGSRYGISGNKIYIDESVFKIIESQLDVLEPLGISLKNKKSGDGILFYVENSDSGWYHIGFQVDNPIEFDNRGVKTHIFKLNKFYTWDEDPKEFHIDVSEHYPYLLTPGTM